jgi:8-oxo-dGTP pyrophosphatase MutT (NUDIX family)
VLTWLPVSGHRAEESRVRLTAADAVAALIVLDEGSYLLQHRDDKPEIWYPDHWGCFGGSIDPGETPLDALHRELYEELELEFDEAEFFARFDFDLTRLGVGRYYRSYYVVSVAAAHLGRLVLHEGREFGAFSGDRLARELRVTPYDAFALFLHRARGRIGA